MCDPSYRSIEQKRSQNASASNICVHRRDPPPKRHEATTTLPPSRVPQISRQYFFSPTELATLCHVKTLNTR